VAPSVEEIVHEEARRGLDLQRAGLDALRTRAGTLLAAASLVTTFLGGQTLEGKGGPSTMAWVAIGAFIAAALLCVVILLPWKFEFSLSAPALVDDYVDKDPQPEPTVVLRNFALYCDESRVENRKKIKPLQWAFRGGALMLAAEVVAWLIAL
jgi:hypothetical protein